MTLPTPIREGFHFTGWYTDDSLPIGGITKERIGDITLHARWIKDDRQGIGWIMTVTGSYHNGDIPHTISGTVTYGYEKFVEDATLLRNENSIEYSWPDGGFTDSSSSMEWITGITEGWMYEGTTFFDGETLTVWRNGDSIMHVRDLMFIVKMEGGVGNDGTVIYELSDEISYEPMRSFSPTIKADYPLSIETPSKVTVGDDITLVSSSEDFEGWYLNGVLVSNEPTCTFRLPAPGDVFEARSTTPYMIIEGISDIDGLGYGDATLYDGDWNEIEVLGQGEYHARILRNGVTYTLDLVVESQKSFHLEWEFDGVTYSYDTVIQYSDVHQDIYANQDIPRFSISSQSHIESFHEHDGKAMEELHQHLTNLGKDMDRKTYASFVLRFVQTIPYMSDIESRGTDEYWKFPTETLWDGNGDCEDKTILYGTLMGMSGYRMAFVMFKDHTMAAIDEWGWNRVNVDGYDFALCETTNTSFEIGDTTNGHHPRDSVFTCRLECF